MSKSYRIIDRATRKSKNVPSYRKVGALVDKLPASCYDALTQAVATLVSETGTCEDTLWERIFRVTLHRNSRAKQRFGAYSPSRFELEINAQLFRNEPKLREEFDRTVLHEMGHMLDYFVFGKLGHGTTWKRCMAALGQPNEARCGEAGILKDDYRWTLECRECGKTYRRHRRYSNAGSRCCGVCKGTLDSIDNKTGKKYLPHFGDWVLAR